MESYMTITSRDKCGHGLWVMIGVGVCGCVFVGGCGCVRGCVLPFLKNFPCKDKKKGGRGGGARTRSETRIALNYQTGDIQLSGEAGVGNHLQSLFSQAVCLGRQHTQAP